MDGFERRYTQKKANTDRILPFEGNYLVAHETCRISFLYRGGSQCSTQKTKTKKRKQIYDICQRNRYSRSFFHQYSEPQHQPSTEKPTNKWFSVSYINAVSIAAARLGLSSVNKPACKFRTKLMKPKGSLDKMKPSAVIYQIVGVKLSGRHC